MNEPRVHVAMDGNSYTEFFEDLSAPGRVIAVFHPHFEESGYRLEQGAPLDSTAPTSRLGQLLNQAFGNWNDRDTPAPLPNTV